MAPKQSEVWKYFENISKDLALCKICQGNFSRSGRGTSSLRKHLQYKHQVKYKELKEKEKEKSWQIQQQEEVASTSSAALLGFEEKTKQQTIIKSLGNMKKWDKMIANQNQWIIKLLKL